MIFFNVRRWVSNQYTNWIQDNKVADTPESVVAYLTIKDYLNESKILHDYKEANGLQVSEDYIVIGIYKRRRNDCEADSQKCNSYEAAVRMRSEWRSSGLYRRVLVCKSNT